MIVIFSKHDQEDLILELRTQVKKANKNCTVGIDGSRQHIINTGDESISTGMDS